MSCRFSRVCEFHLSPLWIESQVFIQFQQSVSVCQSVVMKSKVAFFVWRDLCIFPFVHFDSSFCATSLLMEWVTLQLGAYNVWLEWEDRHVVGKREMSVSGEVEIVSSVYCKKDRPKDTSLGDSRFYWSIRGKCHQGNTGLSDWLGGKRYWEESSWAFTFNPGALLQ